MKTKKSWLVEWNENGGEWTPALRTDTPRTMRAGYMTKGEALRHARSLRASVWAHGNSIKVRVVPVIDHPGVAAWPPYPVS